MTRYVIGLLAALLTCLGAHAEPSKVRSMSFVLLAEPRLPPPAEFLQRLEARLAGRLKIDAIESAAEGAILLRTRGGTVMVGLIGAPLPAGQIDDLCRNAWYWQAACEATARHRAHVAVAVLDTDLDLLDASLLQTDVVAALMDDNAIASYWGASLQSSDAFLKQSERLARHDPPVWLWVNFRVTQDVEKGYSISTEGMDAFGLHEIEAKDVDRNGLEVFGLLVGMAQYLIYKGAVIQDGETIGDSPARNIRVRQGPSYWREGLTVYRVEFPRP